MVGNGCSSAFTPAEDAEVFARATVALVSNAKAHKNVEVVFAALARCPALDLVVVGPSPTGCGGSPSAPASPTAWRCVPASPTTNSPGSIAVWTAW